MSDRFKRSTTARREPGLALWRQIADGLEAQIRAGVFPAGERLPTELALAAEYGVNRHTVRRAMDALARERLVRVERGRGTFVHQDVLEYTLGSRTRFTESLDGRARAPQRQLIAYERRRAGSEIAAALEIRASENVEILELLGSADGRPLSLARHSFPTRRFAGIDRLWRCHASITLCLAELGVPDYTRRSTRITARLPTQTQCELLELPANRPVLTTEGINVDTSGVPVEFGITCFAADRVQLLVES